MYSLENFEELKEKIINENELKYGEEIRKAYGNNKVNNVNKKIKGLTKEKLEEAENLRLQIDESLKLAFETAEPNSVLAQKTCELHKNWLLIYYDGLYQRIS